MPYLELPEEEVVQFKDYKTQPVPRESSNQELNDVLGSGGSIMGAAGNFELTDNMSATTVASQSSQSSTRSQSKKIPSKSGKKRHSSGAHAALLQTGSLKDVPRGLSGQSLQSPSETSAPRSAETKAQTSKQKEDELLKEPLILSD